MVANKKTVVITGGQGVGKSLLAQVIAGGLGRSFDTICMAQLSSSFGMAEMLDIHQECAHTIIVDEVQTTVGDLSLMKSLVSNHKMRIDRKGKHPIEIQTPNFIFVMSHADPVELPRSDRRFMVVEVKGGE